MSQQLHEKRTPSYALFWLSNVFQNVYLSGHLRLVAYRSNKTKIYVKRKKLFSYCRLKVRETISRSESITNLQNMFGHIFSIWNLCLLKTKQILFNELNEKKTSLFFLLKTKQSKTKQRKYFAMLRKLLFPGNKFKIFCDHVKMLRP